MVAAANAFVVAITVGVIVVLAAVAIAAFAAAVVFCRNFSVLSFTKDYAGNAYRDENTSVQACI